MHVEKGPPLCEFPKASYTESHAFGSRRNNIQRGSKVLMHHRRKVSSSRRGVLDCGNDVPTRREQPSRGVFINGERLSHAKSFNVRVACTRRPLLGVGDILMVE